MKEEKLEEAKRLYETANADQKYVLESLYPELAGSEDERIRKELLEHCINRRDGKQVCVDASDYRRWADWLEKQGQVKDSAISQHDNKTCKENDGSLTSEDEKIRKWLIGYFHQYKEDGMERYANGLKVDDILAWLEKQGKSSDQIHYWTEEEIEPIISDYLRGAEHYGGMIGRLRCLKPKSLEKQSETYTKRDVDNAWLEGMASAKRELEKQGEQKPTDKVEPKFKVGDWITNGDYTWKIAEVKPLDYILQSQDGNIVDDSISHVDEQFHSFTIQDAKDGDVIACENGRIGIFKCLNDNLFSSYCFIDNEGWFCGDEGQVHMLDTIICGEIYPATKEQHDLLFRKMKEAGYEWDDEKKELKKIDARENLTLDGDLMEADCMIVEQKPWSKEDDVRLQACIDTLQAESLMGKVDTVMTNWLKSLKDRYTWKPSDAQMASITCAVRKMKESACYDSELVSLLNDLKKLREE